MHVAHAQKFASVPVCVLVYSDAYMSDLNYLQEAPDDGSASSLGTKA